MSQILDGKKIAEALEEQLLQDIVRLREQTGVIPGLTVILVGDDPASRIYVSSKEHIALKLGLKSDIIRLNRHVSRQDLLAAIHRVNEDKSVHAVLVQLPLPQQFDEWDILDHLDPVKDVDRFHPQNLGMLMLNRTDIFPCTPSGCLRLLDHHRIDITGMNAVVAGRSFIVGKPVAAMLTNRNATVTLCHSKTKNIGDLTRQADIIVAAIGKPGFITEDMVKPGAILIDVGINYLDKPEEVKQYCSESQKNRFHKKGYGIAGDIHYKACEKSSWHTPVPGGVGAMTVALLMENTVKLYKKQLGIQ